MPISNRIILTDVDGVLLEWENHFTKWMVSRGYKLKDDFEKIISLVRKTKPTFEHRKEAEKLVQYHIYDIITTESGKLSWTYEERLDHLIDIIHANNLFLNMK